MGSRVVNSLSQFHLRAVKNVRFSFDPYCSNVRSIREVLFKLHTPKLVSTNESVGFKIDVKSDRSEPMMDVNFVDGAKMIFKTSNLTTSEILERLKLECDTRDPRNDAPVVATKSAKKKKK